MSEICKRIYRRSEAFAQKRTFVKPFSGKLERHARSYISAGNLLMFPCIGIFIKRNM